MGHSSISIKTKRKKPSNSSDGTAAKKGGERGHNFSIPEYDFRGKKHTQIRLLSYWNNKTFTFCYLIQMKTKCLVTAVGWGRGHRVPLRREIRSGWGRGTGLGAGPANSAWGLEEPVGEQQRQSTGKANLFVFSHESHLCVCRLDLAAKIGSDRQHVINITPESREKNQPSSNS